MNQININAQSETLVHNSAETDMMNFSPFFSFSPLPSFLLDSHPFILLHSPSISLLFSILLLYFLPFLLSHFPLTFPPLFFSSSPSLPFSSPSPHMFSSCFLSNCSSPSLVLLLYFSLSLCFHGLFLQPPHAVKLLSVLKSMAHHSGPDAFFTFPGKSAAVSTSRKP